MAEYMAKWGNKGFLVSPDQIAPVKNLATSFKRKADENEDTSGTPPTNTRGLENQTITLDTTYIAGTGVDPRAQIEDWKNQFGKQYPLLINGQQFGPDLLELDSVSFSDVLLDNKGNFLRVTASITLVEYTPATKKVSSKTKSSGSSSSSSSSKSSAASATASTKDRSEKKYTPNRSVNTKKKGGGGAR